MARCLRGRKKRTDMATTDWHLDKRLPIALMVILALEGGGFIWWAATIEARMTNVETWQSKNESLNDRMVRMETTLEGVAKTLARIEDKLE